MLMLCSSNSRMTLNNAPGRSCNVIRSRARRPDRARSRSRTLARRRVSMLPPHRTMPIFLPAKYSGFAMTAARPAAPAPSTTVFSIWSSRLTALSSCASLTSWISSTSPRITCEVNAPGTLTAIPSASVSPSHAICLPWSSAYIDG